MLLGISENGLSIRRSSFWLQLYRLLFFRRERNRLAARKSRLIRKAQLELVIAPNTRLISSLFSPVNF